MPPTTRDLIIELQRAMSASVRARRKFEVLRATYTILPYHFHTSPAPDCGHQTCDGATRHVVVRICTNRPGLAAHLVDAKGQPLCKIKLNPAHWTSQVRDVNTLLLCHNCRRIQAKSPQLPLHYEDHISDFIPETQL